MVAPAYAAKRSALAKVMQLGRRQTEAETAAPALKRREQVLAVLVLAAVGLVLLLVLAVRLLGA